MDMTPIRVRGARSSRKRQATNWRETPAKASKRSKKVTRGDAVEEHNVLQR